jgi:hypothetical protein
MALSRRKKSVVRAGTRSTAPVGGAVTPQDSFRASQTQRSGKLERLILASNMSPAPTGESAPRPSSPLAVTEELAAYCSRKHDRPEGGET